MGVTCKILLTNNTKGVYRAGQLVQGCVKYAIDEPTEFSSVTLSLRGKGLCWWVPLLAGMGTIYTGSEDYVNQCMDLLQARENETAAIAAGTYEKQFCFVLPEGIPSSYKDSKCFITYFVELKFVKPNFMSFSKRFELFIKVQGGIKPCLVEPMIYEMKKDFYSSKKTITFSVEIEKMVLYGGETIELKFNIKTQSELAITARRVELIEYITYKSNCNHQKQKSKTVNGLEVNLIGNARLRAKYQGVDQITTRPELFSIRSNILAKEYRVKVTLKFPFPHRELCLEIPVVIAEKINESEEVKLDKQPPSYWQAMNEKNEKEELTK